MPNALAVNTEERLRRIDELDLGPIAFKLVHPEPDVEGMSIAEAERAVMKYRRFLKLIAMYPDQAIVPSKEIDEVWHTHILDTLKYPEDCERAFGFFLHHFPYLGMRGEDDKQGWTESFKATCDLYREHFGEELQTASGPCNTGPSCSGGSSEMHESQLPAGTCSGPCGGPDGGFMPRPSLSIAS